MLEMSSIFISARLDTSDYGLWRPVKRSGVVANGFTGVTKRVDEVSLHFQLELKTLRIEVGRKWGLCNWSCCISSVHHDRYYWVHTSKTVREHLL